MRNKGLRQSTQRFLCIFTDWITTSIAFFCFNIFRFFYLGASKEFPDLFVYLGSDKLILEQIFVPLLLLFVYWLSGYYNYVLERGRLDEFFTTLYSQIFNALVIYLAALTNDQLYLRRENWLLLLVLFLLLFGFVYCGRFIVTNNLRKRKRRLNIKNKTVIVGLSEEARILAEKLTSGSNSSVEIVGFMPHSEETEEKAELPSSLNGVPILENIEKLKALCDSSSIDQIIFVPSEKNNFTDGLLTLLYNLYPYQVSIKINPDILSIITPAVKLEDIYGEPFIDLTKPNIGEFSKNVKRTLDVLTASFGLLILSPFLLGVAIAVKASSKGKVLYRQERFGRYRKPFRIIKFRSMIEDAEKEGCPMLSSDSDPRITRVGKWLRKYRIDEWPQLWNVLKGEMSLVGPRPEREYFVDQIIKKAPWYILIFQVRPGITSWGMVKYGYASNVAQMIERNRFDLIYLSNMSVVVDFKILIHTVNTVLSGKGK